MSKSLSLDKPFLSNNSQIERLIRRGISITDEEKPIVESLIKEHGYYQIINSYGAPFEIKGKNEKTYKENVSFSDIYGQFYLDRKLGRIILNYILDIEEHFSNVVAYHVSDNFGVNNYLTDDPKNKFKEIKSYLDESYYPNSGNSVLKDLNEIALTEQKNPTSWYRNKNNHIPPWILLMNTTLGTTTRYYKILPSNVKASIIDDMLPKNFSSDDFDRVNKQTKKRNAPGSQLRAQYFFLGIELMRNFRNCTAHSSRVYAYKINFRNKLPASTKYLSNMKSKLFSAQEYYNGVGGNDLFALFIWIIICSPNKNIAKDFINSITTFHRSIVEDALPIFLQESSLPENYLERLEQLMESLDY